MKGIDVTAAIVAGDAKDCGGKFASGRMSELVDSEVVFRGFSSCQILRCPNLAVFSGVAEERRVCPVLRRLQHEDRRGQDRRQGRAACRLPEGGLGGRQSYRGREALADAGRRALHPRLLRQDHPRIGLAIRRPLRARRRDPVRLLGPHAAIRQQHRIPRTGPRRCARRFPRCRPRRWCSSTRKAGGAAAQGGAGVLRRFPSAKEFNHLAAEEKRKILAASLGELRALGIHY